MPNKVSPCADIDPICTIICDFIEMVTAFHDQDWRTVTAARRRLHQAAPALRLAEEVLGPLRSRQDPVARD